MLNYWISATLINPITGTAVIYMGDCIIGDSPSTEAAFEAQRAAIITAQPVIITFRQFMALFTTTEQTAIVSSTDTQTRLFLLSASSGSVNLSDPLVTTDLNYLVSIALLTAPRVLQVLANLPPS